MALISTPLRPFLVCVLLLLGPMIADAAPDDVDAPVVAVEANVRFEMNEANFDGWVFQNSGNAKQARERISARLKLQMDELTRVCGLTDEQKQKLALAARLDVKRFFEEVEVVRAKFRAVKNDQNGFNNIWQEIQPLQVKLSAGLFGDSSFYAKTVRRTLTAEQNEKYDAVLLERRRFRYRASVEVSITMLENTVPLRHSQHEQLVKLVLDHTQPPSSFGTNDNALVMYHLAKLPESQLKPLFDDYQWKKLRGQFGQFRAMEQHLVQLGLIPKVEVGVKGIMDRFRLMVGDGLPADAMRPENQTRKSRKAQSPEE